MPSHSSSSTRYLTLTSPTLLTVPGDPSVYLKGSLEDIVANYPPRSRYPHEVLQGLWSGPTGIAYLMLQVHLHKPDLLISGQSALHWAQAYISGSRGHNLRLGSHGCGISDEKLALESVRAAISQDQRHVREFVASVEQVLEVDGYADELLYGRAGTLYLLRLVRHWVPECAGLVATPIKDISEQILENGPEWTWHGRRYLGAVHGEIGILTQLVLTTPELAPRVEPSLRRLLSLQGPDGNWPSADGHGVPGRSGKGLVQFCHGAPGFVTSLLSLREYFDEELQGKIDEAVRRGRENIWAEGLLRKEPSLCHGIFGNALTLPLGPKRDHFLAVAVPENVAHLKSTDETGCLFERADYGRSYSTSTSYTPSAVWTWLVCGEENPGFFGYNDIKDPSHVDE
ncbi:hypothetical protein B0T19DRAFT_83401 [Cercophora scortea]|uniref:Uncharacterized protein n=1 Tax=Cercophora scortea TaxID=314031 RepID=A0AAE0MGE4_9PEZI|nr:hypothetical protein B0T19DRAFT_83401 [Cercophora scortea]